MCGIAGFVDFKNLSSLEILEKCTNVLSHRGPDGSGYKFIQNETAQVGIGHRRLSIIDLSNAAAQPMVYNNFVISFNGEIYNYKEIKQQLIELGHKFQTHSDTEVILHSWSEWGKEMVHHFIGMFVFAIFDQKKNELILFRDRAGVKPLYYYWDENLLIFGSELKALISHPSFYKNINYDSLRLFLQLGYIPEPYSIFQKTFKLPPGNWMKLTLESKNLDIASYWSVSDYYNRTHLDISYTEALNATENLLEKAFQYRLVSDVPVGVFLSGGYDSTAVAALLQKNMTQKIKTFTIGIEQKGFNEAPYASKVATHIGTDHTEYYCSQKEAIEIIPELPYFYDEPFADSSAIPTILVSRIARKSVTVALSADGGDETFAGYNRYEYMMKYGKKVQALPTFFPKVLANFMEIVPANKFPILRNHILFPSRYDRIKSFLKDPSEENFMDQIVKAMNQYEAKALILQETKQLPIKSTDKGFASSISHTLAKMMAIDYVTYLPGDILHKVDRATMSASLEGREPFLDHHIIEWAASLPINYKYSKGTKKRILKDIVHRYVPKDSMERQKAGFGIPLTTWMQNELRTLIEKYLSDEFVKGQQIFQPLEVARIRNAFFSGRIELSENVWYILMFQMWYEKWMSS
jgi:asparagine synthase (glutamine-hydrolysing)